MEMKPELKSVILDFVFLTVDWMGALFSLLALGKLLQYSNPAEKHLTLDVAVQHTFDVLGSVLYILWYGFYRHCPPVLRLLILKFSFYVASSWKAVYSCLTGYGSSGHGRKGEGLALRVRALVNLVVRACMMRRVNCRGVTICGLQGQMLKWKRSDNQPLSEFP